MSHTRKQRMTHKNIPIFIPHLGCPHQCVFCDQRAISGHGMFQFSNVRKEIERALATLPHDASAELAYFGGSFTAIDPDLMMRLLDLAQEYVRAGRLSGIRFSTRPDAVGDEVLDALSDYTVSAIELGLQSMDDEVLRLCHRGHTAQAARDACRRIVARGYCLVGQMMLGLPGSDEQKEIATAMEICDLGAQAVRIYPTVVFDGTPLATFLKRGEYTPLTNEQAALRSAHMLRIFEERGVQVLRVGLCASDMLCSSRVLCGANHPALGELAYAALFGQRMSELLKMQQTKGRVAEFLVPYGKLSQALGQHRSNVTALSNQFALAGIKVYERQALSGTQVELHSLKSR